MLGQRLYNNRNEVSQMWKWLLSRTMSRITRLLFVRIHRKKRLRRSLQALARSTAIPGLRSRGRVAHKISLPRTSDCKGVYDLPINLPEGFYRVSQNEFAQRSCILFYNLQQDTHISYGVLLRFQNPASLFTSCAFPTG